MRPFPALPSVALGALATTLSVAAPAAADQITRVAARARVEGPPLHELRRLLPAASGLELAALEGHRLDGSGEVARYRQTHRGIPVLGRGATLFRGSTAIASAALEERLPAQVVPTVDEPKVREALAGRLRFPVTAPPTLVIFPTAQGGVLAYRYTPRLAGMPMAPELIVDAHSGALLAARDRALQFGATARVYETNPARSPGLVTAPLTIAPSVPDRLESDSVVAKTCVDRGKVAAVPGLPSGLRVCELEATARPNASGDYDVTPNDDVTSSLHNEDAFAEVSMYHHTTRVLSYFEKLAPSGSRATLLRGRPFVAIANLRVADGLETGLDAARVGDPSLSLVPFSNAFFAPGGDGFGSIFGVDADGLWFGQGPKRDYAYDGDVVYHEFSHAVVDATIGLGAYTFDEDGLSAAPGALNEGIADLFAAALSGDPDIGEYAAGDLGAPFVRTLANDDGCPSGAVGEVHFDSTPFSGALWAVRASLPSIEQVVFDRTLVETLLAHPRVSAPRWNEFFDVMLAVFKMRAPVAARALEAELDARALRDCRRFIDATSGAVMAKRDAQGPIGFWSPGTLEVGRALVPGAVTFRVTLPQRSGLRRLEITATTRAQRTSLLSGGGTPFSPVALVTFGAPMRYRGVGHDAVTLETTNEDKRLAAQVDVPAEAQVAYVQIANKGEMAGSYDALQLRVVDVPPPATPAAAPEGDDSPSPTGCAQGRASTGAAEGAGLLFATLLALRLRGRRRP